MSIATTPKPPYYAVIFSSIRTNSDDDYEKTSDRMMELAANQTGFLGVETLHENNFGITISYWSDLASIKKWKANLEHLRAQRSGKDKWYSEFKVRICKVEKQYEFDSKD